MSDDMDMINEYFKVIGHDIEDKNLRMEWFGVWAQAWSACKNNASTQVADLENKAVKDVEGWVTVLNTEHERIVNIYKRIVNISWKTTRCIWCGNIPTGSIPQGHKDDCIWIEAITAIREDEEKPKNASL